MPRYAKECLTMSNNSSIWNVVLAQYTQGILTSIKEQLRDKTVASVLLVLRAKFNLTQKDVADKMGVDVEEIIRIENSPDDELTLEDFERYVNSVVPGEKFVIKVLPL